MKLPIDKMKLDVKSLLGLKFSENFSFVSASSCRNLSGDDDNKKFSRGEDSEENRSL